MKICMVTGHREIPADKIESVREQLRTEIVRAIQNGYTHYISGFASGIDLYFAEIISELKNAYNITLEAAIPYRKRLNTKDKDFHRLLLDCNIIGVHSEKYTPACFMKRNRYMVQQSQLVIAVYDGRQSGGTLATMGYALTLGKDIKIILL